MKHIKKYFTGILAVVLFMQGAQGVFGATEAELQAQIATLLQQVQTLQSKIGGLGAATPSVGYTFSRNLRVGSRGTDVKKLQDFLKKGGYLKITTTTTTFGPATKAALIAWQKANKIVPASGYFGPLTRAKVNALSGVTQAVPGTSGSESVSYISRPVAAVVGSSVAIKFASTAARKANIYLCKAKDDCKTVIAANVMVNTGDNTYTWAVPADVATGAYTIKVEDVARSEWVVYTDVPLTQPVATATSTPPATQPLIAAFALKPPISTMAGEPIKIVFISKNAKNASISLCTDSEHCDVTVTAKFAITDGANSYVWSVPTTLAPRKYIVKIKDADNAASKEFTSDLFAILPTPPAPPAPAISIIQPATIQAGKAMSIRFASTAVSSVNMKLCTSKTECKTTIKDNFVVSGTGTSTYSWTIPTSTPAGEYYINIVGTGILPSATAQSGAIGTVATSVSSEPQALTTTGFIVRQPVATLPGDLLKIVFTSKGVNNASIALCTDSEHCDVAITSKFSITDGVNNYIWSVPTTLAPRKYIIKIKDADNAASKEFTSDLFTILPLPSAVGASPTAASVSVFTKAPFTITAGAGTIVKIAKGYGMTVAPLIAVCTDGLMPIANKSDCYTNYNGSPYFGTPNIKFSATDVTIYEGGAGVVCETKPNPNIIYVETYCTNP